MSEDNLIPDSYFDDDTDDRVTIERAEEFFVGGLQAMREMIARQLEIVLDPKTAELARSIWNPGWGKDPGRPDTIVEDCWEL